MTEPIQHETCAQCRGSGKAAFLPVCPGCKGRGQVLRVEAPPPALPDDEAPTEEMLAALNTALMQAQLEKAALSNALADLHRLCGERLAEIEELKRRLHEASQVPNV